MGPRKVRMATQLTQIDDTSALARILGAADTDIAAFFGMFTDDAVFRMGNNDPVEGIDDIQAWVAPYLGSVASMRHENFDQLTAGETSAIRLDVTYTMQSGETFTLPAVTFARTRGERISEYRISMDPSPIVDASQTS